LQVLVFWILARRSRVVHAASRSAQSGGAHTRTSAPSARNRTASPTSGSTPPRESYVDNDTRTSRLPFP
jgi:hypothetical protein